MDRPLEIMFNGLDASPQLEDEIRTQVDKLNKHFPRLVSCRVTLEADGGKHKPDGHVNVRIMMGLPGHDLNVSHEPHPPKGERSHFDAYTAVRDAFHVAERQLRDMKG